MTLSCGASLRPRSFGPIRMQRRALSSIERGAAVCLAAVWLCGGAFGLYLALVHARWGLAIVSIALLLYGGTWLRVATRSRLLTWQEFLTPWRQV